MDHGISYNSAICKARYLGFRMELCMDHPEKMDIHATQNFHGIHATKYSMESMQPEISKILKFLKNSKKYQNFKNLQFLH